MKLRVVEEAQQQYDIIEAWWRANRDKAPDLFKQEVDHVISLLPSSPRMGEVYKRRGGVETRRVLLEKTQNYLYYWVDDEHGVIHVISIWGTPLEHGPPL